MKKSADVVVIGGGVMGCSILFNLAETGMTNAVLLEKDMLAAGSTGRSQGIIRMHNSNEVTTLMAWESLLMFQNFDEIVGGASSGYTRTGYVLIAGRNDQPAMEKTVAMQQCLGVNTRLVSPTDVMKLSPVLSIRDDEMCVYEPESGYADPYSVTQGYAKKARELGAKVQLDTEVTSVKVKNGRVASVSTSAGEISTPMAVITAGPWSKSLIKNLKIEVPLETVRHQVIVLHRPEDTVPHHPGIGDLTNSFSARPESNGLTLIGVGENEIVGPSEFKQGVDLSVVQDVSEKLTARIPGMSQALFKGGWSGLFTTTPDWHPILDKIETIEGLYIAIGFSGHGFKLAPMVGVVMAQMITQSRSSTIDVGMLGLDRFEHNKLMQSNYEMNVLA